MQLSLPFFYPAFLLLTLVQNKHEEAEVSQGYHFVPKECTLHHMSDGNEHSNNKRAFSDGRGRTPLCWSATFKWKFHHQLIQIKNIYLFFINSAEGVTMRMWHVYAKYWILIGHLQNDCCCEEKLVFQYVAALIVDSEDCYWMHFFQQTIVH